MHCERVLRYPVVSFEGYPQKTEDLPHELRNAAHIFLTLRPILSTGTHLVADFSRAFVFFRHFDGLCCPAPVSCIH